MRDADIVGFSDISLGMLQNHVDLLMHVGAAGEAVDAHYIDS
jgi:hypothetical protein